MIGGRLGSTTALRLHFSTGLLLLSSPLTLLLRQTEPPIRLVVSCGRSPNTQFSASHRRLPRHTPEQTALRFWSSSNRCPMRTPALSIRAVFFRARLTTRQLSSGWKQTLPTILPHGSPSKLQSQTPIALLH